MNAVEAFVYWHRERDTVGRGLRQLRQLRKRALDDPEFAGREAADLSLTGEVEVVPDEHDMVPSDQALVAGYYAKLIAIYERQVVEAQLNSRDADASWRVLWLALPGVARTRPRARSVRARRRRGPRTARSPGRSTSDDPEPDAGLARLEVVLRREATA